MLARKEPEAFLMQDGQGDMGAHGTGTADLCGLEAFMETRSASPTCP